MNVDEIWVRDSEQNDVWFRGVILKKRISLLASPRGGEAASSRKMVRSILIDAAGEVFLIAPIGTPPRPSESGCCAIFS